MEKYTELHGLNDELNDAHDIDEVAHPDVYNVLLQVLDEGRLTDNQGRTVNFKNAIIIMTSNLGASYIMEKSRSIDEKNRDSIYEEIKTEMDRQLKQTLRPEFLNRIDEIIVFHPLGLEEIRSIVDLRFEEIRVKAAQQGVDVNLTAEARDFLAKEGYDPAFGARPLKRTLQRLVTNPLANRILAGDIAKGDVVDIILRENSLDFTSKST